MGEVWAIIVAGGSGSRFGDAAPKQFLELAGLRLIDWALAAAGAACDSVVAVLPAAHLDAVPALNGRSAGGDPEAGFGDGPVIGVAGGRGRPRGGRGGGRDPGRPRRGPAAGHTGAVRARRGRRAGRGRRGR